MSLLVCCVLYLLFAVFLIVYARVDYMHLIPSFLLVITEVDLF